MESQHNTISTTGHSFVVKLLPDTYNLWAKQATTHIKLAGWYFHLLYETFEAYYVECFPPTNKEVRQRKKLDAAYKKPVTRDFSEEQKEQEIETLEDQLAESDLKRANELRIWNQDEMKLNGFFFKTTDDRYHIGLNKCDTAFKMWKKLKKESNQEEAGNLMSLLSQLFQAKFLPNEKLSSFASRIYTIAAKITDLGKEPTWNEIVNFRILSALPNQYDPIQQAIFQLPWKEITSDLLLSKFNAEDSRQEANKLSNSTSTKSNHRNYDEALAATTERKCTNFETCKKFISPQMPTRFKLCLQCHRDKKETNAEAEKKDQVNIIHIL
jgi:hypothetical protein